MSLEIKDLWVHYGKAQILQGISLNADEGEIISIIGSNGAGKTTILRTISGLVRPTSGEIVFKGKRLNRASAHNIVKLGIAHIPANRMVFSEMTILDNLKVGAFLRKDKEIFKDIEAIYEYFPILSERSSQLAGSLSGGEQQMLAMARALMTNPSLLVMDEPSTGLSPIMVAEVASIVKRINESGISVILVEQNARMALKLSQRAYVLQTGRFVLEGESSKLIDNEQIKKAYLGDTK